MNDYLQIRELYHHGVKGQKWGIRKEYEYSKKHSAEYKKSKTIGSTVGAIAGGLAGLGSVIGGAYLINKHTKLYNSDFVDAISGQSLNSFLRKTKSLAVGATFIGGFFGKKIGTKIAKEKSKEKIADDNIRRIEFDNLPKSTQKQLLLQKGDH